MGSSPRIQRQIQFVSFDLEGAIAHTLLFSRQREHMLVHDLLNGCPISPAARISVLLRGNQRIVRCPGLDVAVFRAQ